MSPTARRDEFSESSFLKEKGSNCEADIYNNFEYIKTGGKLSWEKSLVLT